MSKNMNKSIHFRIEFDYIPVNPANAKQEVGRITVQLRNELVTGLGVQKYMMETSNDFH
jgi:hypothetical protein